MKIFSSRNIVLVTFLTFTAMIIFGIFKSSFFYFTKKTPGSFEYIRHGEALLEKSRYQKAIAYFEKAYKSSPENKDIRFYLAYAYSRYAAILAEPEHYDRAIAYLVKAYDVIKEPNTVRNLALMYSRKALYEAKRDDWSAAIEDFTSARLAAHDYDTASKNLSAALFNYAVDEYKSGRERIAIICLKEEYLSHDH